MWYCTHELAGDTVVFLNQIIREASSVMHEQMMKNEEQYASLEVSLSGIKIQDMAAEWHATLAFSTHLSHKRCLESTTITSIGTG